MVNRLKSKSLLSSTPFELAVIINFHTRGSFKTCTDNDFTCYRERAIDVEPTNTIGCCSGRSFGNYPRVIYRRLTVRKPVFSARFRWLSILNDLIHRVEILTSNQREIFTLPMKYRRKISR